MADLKSKLEQQIKKTHVLVFCKSTCPFCIKVKKLFQVQYVDLSVVDLDLIEDGKLIQDALETISGQRTVPNVFINGCHVGGCDSVTQLYSTGKLARLLIDGAQERDSFAPGHSYTYDVAVIGGGSGGLACSKELGVQNVKVVCLDFVKPTPSGTTWGLGGTCVNVGCIPKKLMHQAALLGHSLEDAGHFGWNVKAGDVTHNWMAMVEGIQDHIGSLNWGYRTALRDKNVKYINALASFKDPHTLTCLNKRGKEEVITAARFVIAVGGRPIYPDIPGAKEFGITSDDLFSLQTPPGKTLVIGASYVALECAGFLAGLGYDVTCIIRSIFLRGFDQQMAEAVGSYMATDKVKFLMKCVPTKLELMSEGPPRVIRVEYRWTETGTLETDEYNTVLFAIGRAPNTGDLNLDLAGVKTDAKMYIPTVYEQTNVPHIYAIGDVVQGKQELTPVAIHAGKLLARRLAGVDQAFMDYVNVPTTVFTPLEYGSIGLAEEDAELIYGKGNLEVYHVHYTPLEYTVAKRPTNTCYAKLVCNKKDKERVIGFHVLGPNAGEVTQGFGLAIRLGATKADFDSSVGIHPTTAESFTTLNITKSSGVETVTGGC